MKIAKKNENVPFLFLFSFFPLPFFWLIHEVGLHHKTSSLICGLVGLLRKFAYRKMGPGPSSHEYTVVSTPNWTNFEKNMK